MDRARSSDRPASNRSSVNTPMSASSTPASLLVRGLVPGAASANMSSGQRHSRDRTNLRWDRRVTSHRLARQQAIPPITPTVTPSTSRAARSASCHACAAKRHPLRVGRCTTIDPGRRLSMASASTPANDRHGPPGRRRHHLVHRPRLRQRSDELRGQALQRRSRARLPKRSRLPHRRPRPASITMVTDEILQTERHVLLATTTKSSTSPTPALHASYGRSRRRIPHCSGIYDLDGRNPQKRQVCSAELRQGLPPPMEAGRLATTAFARMSTARAGPERSSAAKVSPASTGTHRTVTRIGQILMPESCANLTFVGKRRNRLFICGSQSVYTIYTGASKALTSSDMSNIESDRVRAPMTQPSIVIEWPPANPSTPST